MSMKESLRKVQRDLEGAQAEIAHNDKAER